MKLLGVACCFGLMACATTASPTLSLHDQQARLVGMLPGVYQSHVAEGARAGRAIHQAILEVAPPEGYQHALYSEMRHGGPNGEMYRQTLFLFATPAGGGLVMTSQGFADPNAALALHTNPDAVRIGAVALKPAIGEGCDMMWRADKDGFVGRIDPQTCEITGRRGDRRRLESVMRIGPMAIEHAEYGYDLEGKLLFGGPPGRRFVWPRQAGDETRASGGAASSDRRQRRGLHERMREVEGRSLVAALDDPAAPRR